MEGAAGQTVYQNWRASELFINDCRTLSHPLKQFRVVSRQMTLPETKTQVKLISLKMANLFGIFSGGNFKELRAVVMKINCFHLHK